MDGSRQENPLTIEMPTAGIPEVGPANFAEDEELKTIPLTPYKPCLSNGREVHWLKIDEETYEAHDGSGKIATGPWERFQAYLDGKTGWPG